MKKLLMFVLSMGLYVGAHAAFSVTDGPIKNSGTPVTLTVSSTTLTKCPTTQTSGRVGVYISNPSTSAVAGFIGDCTSTALAITIRPFEFARNTGDTSMDYIPLREDVCLWLISTDVSFASKSIHYQEVIK